MSKVKYEEVNDEMGEKEADDENQNPHLHIAGWRVCQANEQQMWEGVC